MAGGAPDDRRGFAEPGQDAGGEERGGGGVHGIDAAAGDFVQGAEGKPTFGKMSVERRNAERVCAFGARGGTLERKNAMAELGQSRMAGGDRRRRRAHVRILFPYGGSVNAPA
jgi:hypothetical protein